MAQLNNQSRELARRPGLSLIELIMSIGAMILVAGVLIAVFNLTLKTYTVQNKEANQQLFDQLALERVRRTVRQSLAVATSVTSGATTYTTDAATLVLQLASVDSSQNIIPATYDYIVYLKNPTKTTQLLEVTIPGSGSSRVAQKQVLADSLSVLSFTYSNKSNVVLTSNYSSTKVVNLNLTSQETTHGKNVTYTYSEPIVIRNQ